MVICLRHWGGVVESQFHKENQIHKKKNKDKQDINMTFYKTFLNCENVTGKLDMVLVSLFQTEKADRRQSFASLALRKRYSYLTEPGMSEFSNTFTNLCGFL